MKIPVNRTSTNPLPVPQTVCRVICDLNSFSYLSLASSANTLLLLLRLRLALLLLLLPESSCCTSVVVVVVSAWNIIIIIHFGFLCWAANAPGRVGHRQPIVVCSTSVSSSFSSTASSRNYYLCLHAIFVGLGQIGGTPRNKTWHAQQPYVNNMNATTFWIFVALINDLIVDGQTDRRASGQSGERTDGQTWDKFT